MEFVYTSVRLYTAPSPSLILCMFSLTFLAVCILIVTACKLLCTVCSTAQDAYKDQPVMLQIYTLKYSYKSGIIQYFLDPMKIPKLKMSNLPFSVFGMFWLVWLLLKTSKQAQIYLSYSETHERNLYRHWTCYNKSVLKTRLFISITESSVQEGQRNNTINESVQALKALHIQPLLCIKQMVFKFCNLNQPDKNPLGLKWSYT